MSKPGGAGSSASRLVRAPLLDRLIDDQPDGEAEKPPFRAQTRAEYGRSVLRDLGWLFNARCVALFDDVFGRRTVMDYGVQDFTHLVPSSEADRTILAKWIRQAMKAFEPRLDVKQIHVEPVESNHRVLEVVFEARLIGGPLNEPVSFRAILDMSEGGVKVVGR